MNEKLYYKILDIHKFFEINDVFVNQLCKTPALLQNMLKNIENKINETEFDENLNTLDTDKFVAWLCV
jgi:hypothetical protein